MVTQRGNLEFRFIDYPQKRTKTFREMTGQGKRSVPLQGQQTVGRELSGYLTVYID